MPKSLSDFQKKEMAQLFLSGTSLEDIVNQYGLKMPTIKKHLKSLLGDLEFNKILKLEVSKKFKVEEINQKNPIESNFNNSTKKDVLSTSVNSQLQLGQDSLNDPYTSDENFYEIAPLKHNIDFEIRKDFTSKPIKEFIFPNNSYLIVDKNNELEIFQIKDFPEYSFLSEDDQKNKVIKLFSDKKDARNFCNKNQKIIKVPNGQVFILVTAFLIEKGISRIIFDENLLSI